jgi:hypothetical protein
MPPSTPITNYRTAAMDDSHAPFSAWLPIPSVDVSSSMIHTENIFSTLDGLSIYTRRVTLNPQLRR